MIISRDERLLLQIVSEQVRLLLEYYCFSSEELRG